MTAGEIATLISSYCYRFGSEVELQAQIAKVLAGAGIEAKREVRLNEKDRPDFICKGGIAIEVKIGSTRPQVMAQIHRYSLCEQVTAIVLVSRKARHLQMPATMNGKEIHVSNLMGSAF